MSRAAARRDKLRKSLKKLPKAILVSHETNVSYLTGFTGDSSVVLITPEKEVVISDFRYQEQLAGECPDCEVEIRPRAESLAKCVARICESLEVRELAVEAETLTVAQSEAIREANGSLELVSTRGIVEKLRAVKDKEEIAAIREAIRVAEKAFAVVSAGLRPELTEKQVADALDAEIRRFGGDGCSFPPIVAGGPHAALPHAHPRDVLLEGAEMVLIDWGARVNGYISDLTRMAVLGKLTAKCKRLYAIMLGAVEAAVAAIRPGAILEDVDAAARGVIEDGGYGPNFGHGLGHGIGMQVHEYPRMGVGQKDKLAAGMVVTVEPGIYVSGWGGVRIEQDVLVTRGGSEVLTSLPVDLEACVIE